MVPLYNLAPWFHLKVAKLVEQGNQIGSKFASNWNEGIELVRLFSLIEAFNPMQTTESNNRNFSNNTYIV